MNLTQVLAQLRLDLEQIDEAMAALERLARSRGARRGRPPAWMKKIRRRGRPPGKKKG